MNNGEHEVIKVNEKWTDSSGHKTTITPIRWEELLEKEIINEQGVVINPQSFLLHMIEWSKN